MIPPLLTVIITAILLGAGTIRLRNFAEKRFGNIVGREVLLLSIATVFAVFLTAILLDVHFSYYVSGILWYVGSGFVTAKWTKYA